MGRGPKYAFPLRRQSILLLIRDMQIKVTMKFHLTLIQMLLISEESEEISTGQDEENKKPSWSVGGQVNWHSHF